MKKKIFTLLPLILLLLVVTIFAKEKSKISIVKLGEQTLIAIKDSVTNMGDVSKKYSEAFGEAYKFSSSKKCNAIGGPISVTINYTAEKFVFVAGVPINSGTQIKPSGRVFVYKLPASKTIKYVYIGPYDKMEMAYKEIMKYIEDKKLIQNGYPWEQYISDPAKTDPKKMETDIYFPIK